MAKYIDNNGFAHFLGKLKTLLDSKASASHNHTASEITSGTFASDRLPTASSSVKGAIKVGSRLSISDGVLSATQQTANDFTTTYKNKLDGIAESANNYSLPTAAADTLGGVKVGSRLTISSGVLSADVQSDNNFTTTLKNKLDGIASGANNYTLPKAASDTLGGIKVGSRLSINSSTGVLSADSQTDNNFTNTLKTKLDGIAENANNYSLPTASSSVKGGIMVGNGLSITDGVLSANVQTLPAASASQAGTMSASDYSKLAALPTNATLAATYALKTDITSMYKHKGSVSAVANLPSTGQTAGDVYNVTATGMNYVWTGEDWDALGEIFTIDAMTTTEIDSAFTTAGLSAAS